MVFKTGKVDQHEVTPEVFMVSDQCQALERDHVFAEVTPDTRQVMSKRQPVDMDDLLPTVINNGKNVDTVENDFFLVNIAHGQPKSPEFSIVKHGDSPRENRPTPQIP